MSRFKDFLKDESGAGVVEMILIIVEIFIDYLYVFNVYCIYR